MKIKTNKYLHRLIALVMTAVMILSMVVIDNRFDTSAKNGSADKIIDLDTYITEDSVYDQNVDGSIKLDSVKEIKIAMDWNSTVAFTGDYLLEEIKKDAADPVVATSCDASAADAPLKASQIADVNIEGSEDSYRFIVYKPIADTTLYEFAGVICVYGKSAQEVVMPTISINVADAKGRDLPSLKDKDGKSFFYAEAGSKTNVRILVSDGTGQIPGYDKQTPEDPSDIVKVTYTVNDGVEKEIAEDANSGYELEIKKAGTYTFKAYNRAGKSAAYTTVIRYTKDIEILDVTVDDASELKYLDGTIAEFLNKTGADISVTVSATEKLDEELYASLNLAYCFVNGETQGNWQYAAMDLDEETGVSKKTIVVPKSTVAGQDYKVILKVCDATYTDICSYKFDENGSFVFIDNDGPVFANGTISVKNGSDSSTYNFQDYNYSDQQWFSEVMISGLKVREDFSPIGKIQVQLDGTDIESVADVSANGNIYAHTFQDVKVTEHTTDSGKHTVKYTAENILNQKETKTVSFNLDCTMPAISIQSQSEGKELADNVKYAVAAKSGEVLTIRTSDTGSGIDSTKTKVYVNNTEKTLTGGKLTLDEVGKYEVKVVAVDKAGNFVEKSVTVYVNNEDLQASLTVTSEGQTIDSDRQVLVYTGHNGNPATVVYEVTGFDLDADDVTASVRRKAANASSSDKGVVVSPSSTAITDASGMKKITMTYNLTVEGEYTFQFQTKHHYFTQDANKSGKSFNVVYDKTAPTVVTMEFVGAKASADNVYYFSKDPSIHIMAEDAFALNEYKIKDENGNTVISDRLSANGTKKLDKTFVLTSGIENNKIYSITFYVNDKSQNETIKSGHSGITYRFAVDTEKPSVSIADKKSDSSLKLKKYWNGSGVTVSASANDNFYISKIKASATCDGKAVEDQEQKFTPLVTSASADFRYTKAGVYEVTITAYDEVGNTQIAKCSFVIDKTSADINITGIPSNGVYRNDGTQPITINVTDDYGITASDVIIKEVYETYDYDGKSNGTQGKKIFTAKNVSGSVVTATIKDSKIIDKKPMKYYIVVTATDNSGNKIEKRSKTFYYDTYKPEITVDPTIAGTGVNYYNDKVRFKITVNEQFELGANIYVLNTEDYEKCKSEADYAAKAYKSYSYKDVKNKSFNLTVSKADRYKWKVVAVDAFGNVAATSNIRFTIDKEKPYAEIEGVPENKKSTGTRIKVVITDNEQLDPESFKVVQCYKYFDGTEYIEKELTVKQVGTKELEASAYCGQKDGKACSYMFKVTGKDRSGNEVEYNIDDSKFKVDSTLPDISFDVYPDSVNDGYYNKNVSFKFTVTEQFPLKTKITVTDKNKDVNGDEDETYIQNETTGTYTVKRSKPGIYNLTIKAVDAFGNVNYVNDLRIVIDKEKPAVMIEGVPENRITQGTQVKITVTDNQKVQMTDIQIVQCYKGFDETKYTEKKLAIKKIDGKTLEASAYCGQKNGKACSYVFKVTGKDKAGNDVEYYIDQSRFKVDATLPDIAVDVYPDSVNDGYYNKNVEFKFTVTEQFPLKTMITITDKNKEVNGDEDESYVQNETTGTYTVKRSKPGIYNLTIKAVDAFGNINYVRDIKFVIDKEKPVAVIEGVPESGLSQGTKVKITVTDNQKLQLNDFQISEYYKCFDETEYTEKKLAIKKVDGKTLETSAYCGQKNGKACAYYFTVTGTDKAGNKVTYNMADSRFKVDTTKPKVTITPRLEQTNDGYYNTDIAFDIAVEEQFAETHTIVVSDKNKEINGDADDTFTMKGTSGTYTVKRNAQGTYNLKITVTDAFGNVTEDEAAFIIDTTKPTIGIATVNKLNNGNVALNVSLADNYKGKSYTVYVKRKDASGAVVYDGDYRTVEWNGASENPEIVFSDEGDYEITVSANDKAGNEQIAESVSFRIDKTAPVLSITGVADSQNTSCTATLTVNEAFTFSYDGAAMNSADITATITKKTDGTAASTVATLNTGNFSSGNPHTATYTFDEDGEYTITFNAKDMTGNPATAVTKTFKVDKTAPELKVTAVNSKNNAVNEYETVGGSSVNSKDYVDMNIAVTESFFASNKVNISVQKDGEDVSSAYFANFNSSAMLSQGSQRFDEDGVYTVAVTAEDALGNKAEDYNMVFTVDNTPPTVEKTAKMTEFADRRSADGELLLNSQDFADIKEKGYEALWSVNDTSVFKASVKLDGIDFVDFSDLADGYHTMTISVTDEVGHVTADSFDFTYDGTAPRIIITGVDDKSVVRNPFTMKIGLEDADDMLTEIVINGKTIDPSQYQSTNSYEFQVENYGDYEVRVSARDTAGNVTSTYDSATDEVFSFRLKEKTSPILIVIIILAILAVVAVILLLIMKKRRNSHSSK